MGIPFYFKHVITAYPEVMSGIKSKSGCDRLFLDFNCLVHHCASIVNKQQYQSKESLEKDVLDFVIEYLKKIIKIAKPRQLIYIGVDGLCPRAKMAQQRKRRYLSCWKNDILNSKRKELGMYIPLWDSNCVTPGTEFMTKLNTRLDEFKNNFVYNKNVQIIVSDSTEN
jgi:5'-3' exoribonuclease 1